MGLVDARELVVCEGREFGRESLGLDLVGMEGGALLAVGGFHFGIGGGLRDVQSMVGFV